MHNKIPKTILSTLMVTVPLALQVACGKQTPSFKESYKGAVGSLDGTGAKIDPDGGVLDHYGNRNDGSGSGEFSGALDQATIEAIFAADATAPGTVSRNWGDTLRQQTIVMDHERTSVLANFHQAQRPQHTELFSQGGMDGENQESFTQSGQPTGLLDILIVIDNSGSMKEEQTNLAGKLNPLLQYVSDSDWRIGVVTTDPTDGCLRALIKKGDANYESRFANAIQAGTSGSGNERGILQAVNGLAANCMGGTWLRPNSTVAVLIVSDEDNCSDGRDCGAAPYATEDYLIDYLASIREVGVNARVYGLIWHDSQPKAECRTAYNQALIYSRLIRSTSGSFGSICSGDYTNTLASISHNISVILKSQFALQNAPTPGSLVVKLNGVVVTSGFTVTGNVLEFQRVPADRTVIQVAYHYTVKAPTTEFQLHQVIDPATLEVFIDGAPANKASYSFNPNNQKIVFNSAPSAKEIRAVYLPEKNSLPTLFPVESNLDPSSIKVTVNNIEISRDQYGYLPDQNSIKFVTPPPDGATITVAYDKLTNARLIYPALVPEAALNSLVVSDQSGSAVRSSYLNRNIIFQPEEFEMGRVILLTYDVPPSAAMTIDLVYPISTNLPIIAEGASGRVCAEGSLLISGSVINMERCQFDLGEMVTVKATVIVGQNLNFTLEDERLADPDSCIWQVFVNDVEVFDFTRVAATVSLATVKAGAIVTIKVSFLEKS